MEYLFEFILELIFEGSIEISKNKKIPKYIRYPLILLISLVFIIVIGLIFLTGILSWQENAWFGLFFMLISLFIFIMCIIKFRKTYLMKKTKVNSSNYRSAKI